MKRVLIAVCAVAVSSMLVPSIAQAGLFGCKHKNDCCEAAPVCEPVCEAVPVCCEPAPVVVCEPAPVCCEPAPVCAPAPVCCPAPPVEVTWCVIDPRTCCPVEVTACVPAECAGQVPALVDCRKGFLHRSVLTYKFECCGHCVDVVVTKHGRAVVRG